MMKSTEAWVTMSDGQKLYEKVWMPDPPTQPTARLIFLHGFSDHCNAYYDLFPTLSSPPYNITVYALDQRGWGRSVTSPSQKGLTGSTALIHRDIAEYISHVSPSRSSSTPNTNSEVSPPSSVPVFLMGHSMGGQQALHYLLFPRRSSTPLPESPPISGLILEAPYIAVHPSSRPSSLIVALGTLASYVSPNRQMVQKLDPKLVSRDPQVQKEWSDDPLCHDTGTLRGLSGMLSRAGDLDRLSRQGSGNDEGALLMCPIWWGHGTDDQVTSFDASRRLFDKIEVRVDGGTSITGSPGASDEAENKTFVPFHGGYHKLHAEPEGMAERFAATVGEWIVQQTERIKQNDGSKEGPVTTATPKQDQSTRLLPAESTKGQKDTEPENVPSRSRL